MEKIILFLILLPIQLFSQFESISSIELSRLDQNGEWQLNEKYVYEYDKNEEELKYVWKDEKWILYSSMVRTIDFDSGEITRKLYYWNNKKWELKETLKASKYDEDKNYRKYNVIKEYITKKEKKKVFLRTRKIKKSGQDKVLTIRPVHYVSVLINVTSKSQAKENLILNYSIPNCGHSNSNKFDLYYDKLDRLKSFKSNTRKGEINYKAKNKNLSPVYNRNIFNIYPNPVDDILTIEQKEKGSTNIKIINKDAKVIYENSIRGIHKSKIDLSFMRHGNYILILERKGRIYSKKLIK